MDYSDDETERRAKAKLRTRGVTNGDEDGDVGGDDDASENGENVSPQKCRQLKRYVRHSVTSVHFLLRYSRDDFRECGLFICGLLVCNAVRNCHHFVTNHVFKM